VLIPAGRRGRHARLPDPDATVPDPEARSAGEELPDDGEQAPGRRTKSWRQLMMVVLAAIVLMLLIKAFIVQVYRIPSSSMEDTLLTGDRVLVNKLVYHVRGIARGDIVVFSGAGSWGTTTGEPDPSPPANPLLRAGYDVLADIGVYSTQTYYIKRVIGLPGDHVVCCVNGRVTVNGVPLDEKSYLFPGARPSMQSFNVIVPPGRLWVMGDNRAISDDSRGHKSAGSPGMGTIPENEVAGRAFMIIWPPSQLGDLPVPATFQQAALHAGEAAAAVTAVPAAGAAALAGIPVLALRTLRVRRVVRRVRAGRQRSTAAGLRSRCTRRPPRRDGRR
jgi:signal peptidase I